MSKTTDFIINNPGKAFDGSDIDDSSYQPSLPMQWKGKTKKEIEALVIDVVENALEWNNAVSIAEGIATLENFTRQIKDNSHFKDAVLVELTAHSGKLKTVSGASIELMEGGVKYDYSHNSEWVRLNALEQNIAKERKALEEKLKKIPAGKMLVDEETGEALYGAPKTSTTTYKITLAK